MSKIGFLDSGIGGLSVLEAFCNLNINSKQSQELSEVIYLADTLNLPYGGKSLDELYAILRGNLAWFDRRVETLVLACNTSSALMDNILEKEFPRLKVIGLIQSLANEVAENFHHLQNIAVFSTLATHNSGAYTRKLKEVLPLAKVVSVPCPKLVPCIEEHIGQSIGQLKGETEKIIQEYSQNLNFVPQAVVFGCTHYAFAKDAFHKIFPEALLLDPAEAVVKQIADLALHQKTKFSAFSSSDTSQFEAKLSSLKNLLGCAKNFGSKVSLAETTSRKVEPLKS